MPAPFKTWRLLNWELTSERFLSGGEPWDTYTITIEVKALWGLLRYTKKKYVVLNMFHNWQETLEKWNTHREWSHILKQQKQNSYGDQ